jgi:hypothetical protein
LPGTSGGKAVSEGAELPLEAVRHFMQTLIENKGLLAISVHAIVETNIKLLNELEERRKHDPA